MGLIITKIKKLVIISPCIRSQNDLEAEIPLRRKPATDLTTPLPRICRYPVTRDMSVEIQNGENNPPNIDTPQQQPTDHKLKESLPRFGHYYGKDMLGMAESKKQAFEHVLEKTGDGRQVAKEAYTAAMREVFTEAKNIYSDTKECPDIAFRKMMVKDGCFFLQLALLILGGSEQLGYHPKHIIFGRKLRDKDVKQWIESMFFVGNQIPLVVLKVLMAQKFFMNVIKHGKWDPPPPSALCKKVLYDLLILPTLSQGTELKEQPSDVLHYLHNLVMGPGRTVKMKKMKSKRYQANYEVNLEPDDQDQLPKAIYMPGNIPCSKGNFRSATDLVQSGIGFKILKVGGVESISFKNEFLWATIYLPALTMDDDVEIILRNLAIYENIQREMKGEVNSYIRFMNDLVQTSEDVRVLGRAGIIQLGSSYIEYELPSMLSELSTEDIQLTQKFDILKRRITDYSPSPWAPVFTGTVTFIGILSFVQTVFVIATFAYTKIIEQKTK